MRQNKDTEKSFSIIGGGWYGSHLALYLNKKNSNAKVTIFEKNKEIFRGISGKFGIRLHAGPHYPRSSATRKSCHEGFKKFCHDYPDLVNFHSYSIYGLGTVDANGEPSKVNGAEFESVCKEFGNACKINPEEWGYQNLITAFNIDEPSMVLGKRLRNTFKKYLKEAGIILRCGFEVRKVKRNKDGIIVSGTQGNFIFDYVINTTSYQALLPLTSTILPAKMKIVYQPCLALVYKDTRHPLPTKPISFIVMDGWFPCLMPYDDRKNQKQPISKYIVTHGKWTIMGSYETASEAQDCLDEINDNFINKNVRPNCEKEMIRFWPEFKNRFLYIQWIGAVLAKIKTEREFRSAVTFQDQLSGMIYVIPGKVSNVFDVSREVLPLVGITNQKIIREGQYQYVKEGVLDKAVNEIIEKPKNYERNTCGLQTYKELDAKTTKHNNGVTFWNLPSPTTTPRPAKKPVELSTVCHNAT